MTICHRSDSHFDFPFLVTLTAERRLGRFGRVPCDLTRQSAAAGLSLR